MAFRLSKQDIKERDQLVEAARTKLNILNNLIEEHNQEVAEIWGRIEDALTEYNQALADTSDFVERVKYDAENEYDEKSEKWQEGDEGMAAREWIDSFDAVELDDAEIDEPEAMEEVSGEGLDALENLDTEAAS